LDGVTGVEVVVEPVGVWGETWSEFSFDEEAP
jgi:hypothetical protein